MRDSDLVDFNELVKDEILLANDLLLSKSAIDQDCERSSKGLQQNPKHKRNKLTKYVTMADSIKTTGLEMRVAFQKKHPLDKFESIIEKPLNERIKILRKGNLCYGCIKPMAKDHNAKNCQQQLAEYALLVIQQYSMVMFQKKKQTTAREHQTLNVYQEMQLEKKM